MAAFEEVITTSKGCSGAEAAKTLPRESRWEAAGTPAPSTIFASRAEMRRCCNGGAAGSESIGGGDFTCVSRRSRVMALALSSVAVGGGSSFAAEDAVGVRVKSRGTCGAEAGETGGASGEEPASDLDGDMGEPSLAFGLWELPAGGKSSALGSVNRCKRQCFRYWSASLTMAKGLLS